MWEPKPETKFIVRKAMEYVKSVPYTVTARWVFYRLLQDGILETKADYKRLLSYLSKARKEFYGGWTPYTLADDTREAVVKGGGPSSPEMWLLSVRKYTECHLDQWKSQPNYVEVWFEAQAMTAQFEHYCNEHITLLPFHGDVSIPTKWEAAERIYKRWGNKGDHKDVYILYYGDFDEKGLQIPESARKDVCSFVFDVMQFDLMRNRHPDETEDDVFDKACDLHGEFMDSFHFERVGINSEHPSEFSIPENPERPGTYQWEALDDYSAAQLIEHAELYLDFDKFEEVDIEAADATVKFRNHLKGLEF